MNLVGICWQLGNTFGWGVYGYQIALGVLRHGKLPALMEPPGPLRLDHLETRAIEPAMTYHTEVMEMMKRAGEGTLNCRFPILHARGNNSEPQFGRTSLRARGTSNHGLIFFENTRFSSEALHDLKAFDTVIAGSTWNGDVLRALGVENVRDNIQGVEIGLFHPGPSRDLFPGRFVIFSGGKLEFRKGQDLVVAAVAAFRQRHPETLLMTSWNNYWPRSAGVTRLKASPYLKAEIELDVRGKLAIDRWLSENGIPPEDSLILPDIPNGQMPQILREADVAIFPNRCEGGTNLVAMEALACGVPCLVSANTGHMDLLNAGAGIALTQQGTVASLGPDDGTEGWGESSVEEIVEGLETVWQKREAARAQGKASALAMEKLSWRHQIDQLMDYVGILK